ncbi:M28 family peptidase [Leucobacter viscericola]|uniref:M28 family peptidase n=1 Tax=Leucobacter viscericola TaxID=2714935 RepID=A0A6G7XG00_9MICO|nr:M28 family peptidase [Leucobacter viscericola]QIK63540.1 M28 family peptidase [Leucobacter viscericola]
MGAAVIIVPLAFTSTTALAAPYTPPGAAEAIASNTYLPDYVKEYASQANAANAFEHVRHLAVDIGPRVAGTAAEDAGIQYVKSQLESYGFTTEVETFPVSASTYANVTPSRDTGLQVSWQYRPAANALFTGSGAPVVAEVADIGSGATITPAAVNGKFVLVDWNATAATRNAIITDLVAAGAAGIIFTMTTDNSSLANPGTVPAAAAGIQVLGAASGQGARIRELLATGPLTLSIKTEQSRTTSSNVVGVRPAVGDTNGTAPIVYIGSHIDSVVGSPGASDNASGVGIMLETARIMSKYSLDTEIRVGAWGAEEKGVVGSKFHAQSLTPEEIARTYGAWNMDMAGTSFAGTASQPTEFWGLSVDENDDDNKVLNQANAVSEHTDRGAMNRGYVGRSDHQSFRDVGIDAAVFSWMYWSKPTSIVLEPTYHKPSDTIDNISQDRLGIASELIGGSAFRASLNTVNVKVTDENGGKAEGVPVAMSCGDDDGWRKVGTTNDEGVASALAPHVDCDVAAVATNGAVGATLGKTIAGETDVEIPLILDKTAPAVSITTNKAAPVSGWYTGPVDLIVTARDEVDQAPDLEYSLDDTTWSAYAAPVTVAAEGTTAFKAHATDGAGNVGEATHEVKIDSIAPTLTATASSVTRGTVSVSAKDETSGVDSIEYRLLPKGKWTSFEAAAPAATAGMTAALASGDVIRGTLPIGADATSVAIRATDVAGNTSALASVEFEAGPPKVIPPEGITKPNDPLATTGAEQSVGIGALVAALLTAGGISLYATRRRRAKA